MPLLNEDFDRCNECDHAYFVPIQTVLIAKGSDYKSPTPLRGVTQYKCAKCGHLQYER